MCFSERAGGGGGEEEEGEQGAHLEEAGQEGQEQEGERDEIRSPRRWQHRRRGAGGKVRYFYIGIRYNKRCVDTTRSGF